MNRSTAEARGAPRSPGVVHTGRLVHLRGAPQLEMASAALVFEGEGALAVCGEGRIAWSGAAAQLPTAFAAWPTEAHDQAYLIPGFVDLHVHFPQVHCIDAFGGGQLLSWLERHVFPSELRLADAAYAQRAADHFCDALIDAGTTTALIFGSQFPSAQEALFTTLHQRGLRAIVGRSTMTQGPAVAEPLCTDLDRALALVREEVERWHPSPEDARALLGVAVVPRFALSLEREGLEAFGELYEELRQRGVWFTTHLSENATPEIGEVAQVLRAYGVPHYLDTYDGRFGAQRGRTAPGFLGPRSVFAHGVHCTDPELARLAETNSSIAHCPVSQDFLASGTMPLARVRRAGVNLGLGSDIGAGDRYCIAEVANRAFGAQQNASEPTVLDGPSLLWLATLGGARALDLEDRIGNLDAGRDADWLLVDGARDPQLGPRLEELRARGAPAEQELFALLMGLSPRAIAARHVQGRAI